MSDRTSGDLAAASTLEQLIEQCRPADRGSAKHAPHLPHRGSRPNPKAVHPSSPGPLDPHAAVVDHAPLAGRWEPNRGAAEIDMSISDEVQVTCSRSGLWCRPLGTCDEPSSGSGEVATPSRRRPRRWSCPPICTCHAIEIIARLAALTGHSWEVGLSSRSSSTKGWLSPLLRWATNLRHPTVTGRPGISPPPALRPPVRPGRRATARPPARRRGGRPLTGDRPWRCVRSRRSAVAWMLGHQLAHLLVIPAAATASSVSPALRRASAAGTARCFAHPTTSRHGSRPSRGWASAVDRAVACVAVLHAGGSGDRPASLRSSPVASSSRHDALRCRNGATQPGPCHPLVSPAMRTASASPPSSQVRTTTTSDPWRPPLLRPTSAANPGQQRPHDQREPARTSAREAQGAHASVSVQLRPCPRRRLAQGVALKVGGSSPLGYSSQSVGLVAERDGSPLPAHLTHIIGPF